MNHTPTAVDRAGKSIGVVNHVCTIFEAQLVGAAYGKDLDEILACLEEAMVFHSI